MSSHDTHYITVLAEKQSFFAVIKFFITYGIIVWYNNIKSSRKAKYENTEEDAHGRKI